MRWENNPSLPAFQGFWQQEGHTASNGREPGKNHPVLNVYADFCEEVLAIPVIRAEDGQGEFAGAEATLYRESLIFTQAKPAGQDNHNWG